MTVPERVLAWASEREHEVVLLEPPEFYDRFLLGVAVRFGIEPVLVYDLDAIRRAHVEEDGMTYEEADYHLAYNTLGAWFGDGTPIFLFLPE